MRPKRPTHVLIDQVRITRDGDIATIDHSDPNLSGAHITIGPAIATMTDADIVKVYNDILNSQWALLQNWDKTVVEEPPGEPQIDYHETSDQWAPRGDVLRCIIHDAGPNGEVTIHIDDQELSRGVRSLARHPCRMGDEDRVRPRGVRDGEPESEIRKLKERKRQRRARRGGTNV